MVDTRDASLPATAGAGQYQMDLQYLLKLETTIEQRRDGSVLGRDTILKADHFRRGLFENIVDG